MIVRYHSHRNHTIRSSQWLISQIWWDLFSSSIMCHHWQQRFSIEIGHSTKKGVSWDIYCMSIVVCKWFRIRKSGRTRMSHIPWHAISEFSESMLEMIAPSFLPWRLQTGNQWPRYWHSEPRQLDWHLSQPTVRKTY